MLCLLTWTVECEPEYVDLKISLKKKIKIVALTVLRLPSSGLQTRERDSVAIDQHFALTDRGLQNLGLSVK